MDFNLYNAVAVEYRLVFWVLPEANALDISGLKPQAYGVSFMSNKSLLENLTLPTSAFSSRSIGKAVFYSDRDWHVTV